MDVLRPSPWNTSQIHDLALEKTSSALQDAFSVLDDTLFNLSQKSTKSYHMDALRILRTQRDSLLAKWKRTIGEAFTTRHPPYSPETSTLTLVPNDELEKQLAVQQMGALWIKHHTQEVSVLERLLESAHTDPHQFPLHPHTLSYLVGQWIENVDLPTESQLVSLKILEREFNKSLRPLYLKTIDFLRSQGLKDTAPPVRRPPTPQTPLQYETPPWLEQVEPFTPQEQTQTPHYGPPNSTRHWDSNTQQVLAHALNQLLVGEKPVGTSGYAAQSDWNIDPVNWDPTAEDLLQVLRSRRNTRPALPTPVPTMSHNAVRSVLDVLQRDLPQSIRDVARDASQFLTKQFKAEVLDRALQIGVRDEHSALTERDEDAIDIVGMLFEIFLSEREIIADMRENIAQLLAAYVKVALNDRKLFMHKAHPARRFLDALAHACEGNTGVSVSERNTLNKVNNSIENLVANFNEDVAIFELAESEIVNAVAQHKFTVENSEKRTAEAQKGSERLEFAQRQSLEIFERHTQKWPWAVQQLAELKKYWLQHHTMTVLRNETSPEKIKNSEDILEQILTTVGSSSSVSENLRNNVHTILEASGVSDTAASSLSVKILNQMQNISNTNPCNNELESKSKENPFSEISSIQSHVTASTPLSLDQDISIETHQNLVKVFKAMSLGTWVDFVRNDGQIVPTKLSWISPISMRLLFVTTRGTKHAVEYPEDLAKLVLLDRVRLRSFNVGENAFGHSFQRAVSALSSHALQNSNQDEACGASLRKNP